jgi:hypothetical protein
LIEDISLDQLYLMVSGPGTAGNLLKRTAHGPHSISGLEQRRNQPPADITGCACDKYGSSIHLIALQYSESVRLVLPVVKKLE